MSKNIQLAQANWAKLEQEKSPKKMGQWGWSIPKEKKWTWVRADQLKEASERIFIWVLDVNKIQRERCRLYRELVNATIEGRDTSQIYEKLSSAENQIDLANGGFLSFESMREAVREITDDCQETEEIWNETMKSRKYFRQETQEFMWDATINELIK